MTEAKRVAVVGGGAAGLMAAIFAARQGAQVSIYEAADRVGKKILRTGNGRCNLSNTKISPLEDYHNGAFVKQALEALPCDPVQAFQDMGLFIQTDAAGRVYPLSNRANTVLNLLRTQAAHLGVQEICGFQVVDIAYDPSANGSKRFLLQAQSGETAAAQDLILCVGGDGNALWRLLGHPVAKCQPVLAPLATDTAPIKGLNDIRVQAGATLRDAKGGVLGSSQGELLFRDYGVSGIMVFDLSRAASAGDVLSIDFMPDWDAKALQQRLEQQMAVESWQNVGQLLQGMLHERVAQALCRRMGLSTEAPVTQTDAAALAAALKDFPLVVKGVAEPKLAQVMRGGAKLDAFDPATMASRLVPGLYGAGESLDVDGRCGGYNLHWAWASGMLAGINAGRG